MQKLTYNKDTKQFELYLIEDMEFNSPILIKEGEIESIVEYKISELIGDMVDAYISDVPFKKKYDGLIYVSKVFKSKSKKSVHQFQNRQEIYNLPEIFRTEKFNSVIALQRGPFDKKRIGNQLAEVEEYHFYQVIFVGSQYQCISRISYEIIGNFVTDVCDSLPITTEYVEETGEIITKIEQIEKIEEAIREDNIIKLISKILVTARAEYEELEKENNRNEEHDLQDLLDMSEEEERWMDEETDGFWRWNID